VALRGRKLRISVAGKILYLMTRVKVDPETFRSRFCRTFCATYTREYTVGYFKGGLHLTESEQYMKVHKQNATQKRKQRKIQQNETVLDKSPLMTIGQEMRWAYL